MSCYTDEGMGTEEEKTHHTSLCFLLHRVVDKTVSRIPLNLPPQTLGTKQIRRNLETKEIDFFSLPGVIIPWRGVEKKSPHMNEPSL